MAKNKKKQVSKNTSENKKKPDQNTKSAKNMKKQEKPIKDADFIKNDSKKETKTSSVTKNINAYMKYIKIAVPVILIFLAMFVAYDVRTGPVELQGLKDRIEANTYANIQNLISQQIDQQYPNLNPTNKQELLEEEFAKVVESGEIEVGPGQKMKISDIVEQNQEAVIDAFQADNGQTYLNAIDPYYFYRLSELHAKNGYVGDEIREIDGKETPVVSYRLAPNGVLAKSNPEFHVWLLSSLFKANDLTYESSVGEKTKAIFLVPVFFAMLSIIPAYFLIRKFSNDLFAFFGSIFLATVGTYVSRTVAGFVDTDAYNVFFPLAIVAIIAYAFVYKDKKTTLILSVLAGFFQGMFLWAWTAGWFIFVFCLVALIGYLAYLIVRNIARNKFDKTFINTIENELIMLVSFIVSSFIFVYAFAKDNLFSLTMRGITGGLESVASISANKIWPNVLSSVAELNSASFGTILNSIGGEFVFLIAMFGLMYMALDSKKNKEEKKLNLYSIILLVIGTIWFAYIIFSKQLNFLIANSPILFLILTFIPVGFALILSLFKEEPSEKIFISILLSVWIAGTMYMTFNGQRFILLLAPAFATAFAVGLFSISKIINDFLTSEFKISNDIGKVIGGFVIVGILFFVLFSPQLKTANAISDGTAPNFDDAWYSTMEKIKENSSEDAIITSWWDFGHFFAATSKRGVTFDGGSQGYPVSHWVGKLLMENNEKVSVDILRMMACGGNNAFDTMFEFVGEDNSDAVLINKIIYDTFAKTKLEKIETIRNNKYYSFTDEQIDTIMEELHCDEPPENFLITSEDMVSKSGVWAHWGSWDFSRKFVLDNYKTLSANEIAERIDENVSRIERLVTELEDIDKRARAENIKRDDLVNQWLAPYPGYIPLQNSYIYPCSANDETSNIECQNGVEINMFSGNVRFVQDDTVKFSKLFYMTEDGINEIFVDPSGTIDATLIPTGVGTYNILLSATPLGGSTFTKLFYLNGFGTKYFENFDDVRSATGVRVITWKVNFDAVDEEELDTEFNELFDENLIDTSELPELID